MAVRTYIVGKDCLTKCARSLRGTRVTLHHGSEQWSVTNSFRDVPTNHREVDAGGHLRLATQIPWPHRMDRRQRLTGLFWGANQISRDHLCSCCQSLHNLGRSLQTGNSIIVHSCSKCFETQYFLCLKISLTDGLIVLFSGTAGQGFRCILYS